MLQGRKKRVTNNNPLRPFQNTYVLTVTETENKNTKSERQQGVQTHVTNMSSVELTEPELYLFYNKGLKFKPTRVKVDKIKLLTNLCEWERRMRPSKYAKENTPDDKDNFICKQKMYIHTACRQRPLS